MKALVIDLTHGGITIIEELQKLKFEKIYAYDIYNTTNKQEKEKLKNKNIKLLKNLESLSEINENEEDFHIIKPIHCPITDKELKKINENFIILNFHQITEKILKKWNEKRKKEKKILIEITGVKGKTSTANIIKEVLKYKSNILTISSIGAYYYKNQKEQLLEKNISINPTTLIKLIRKCEKENITEYDYLINESSLGVSPINDISILTNIIEDYPIGKNTKKASDGKKQIFTSKNIIGEYETLQKYYPNEIEKLKYKINTYSLTNPQATVKLKNKKQTIESTLLNIEYKNLKTINNKKITGKLHLETFAPGEYNILNVLSAITTLLTLEIDKNIIKNINNYNGIPGRTSKKNIEKSTIIEEINPGLNSESIKKSLEIVEDLKNYSIILGGQYGITCEEINEEKLVRYLEEKIDTKNINIILVDELGESIKNKIKRKIKYCQNYKDALEYLIGKNKNILMIYRSNYKNLNKR